MAYLSSERSDYVNYLVDVMGYSEEECKEMTILEMQDVIQEKNQVNEFLGFIK